MPCSGTGKDEKGGREGTEPFWGSSGVPGVARSLPLWLVEQINVGLGPSVSSQCLRCFSGWYPMLRTAVRANPHPRISLLLLFFETASQCNPG